MMKKTISGAALAAGLLLMAPQAMAERLTFALSSNVTMLDPHLTTTVGTDLSVISHLYTSLVIRDASLKLQPALAKSWRAVDDKTWRFELRDDVIFPDGEKLDAAAVKWNIERALDPNTKAPVKPWLASIDEVRVVSPTVVEFITKAPYPALPDQLSMIFLLPPQWTGSHKPGIEALGTGPYDLVEFKPGDHVALKAKSNYWGDKPAFDEVVFRIIPEDASRIAALLAGEVDLISSIPPSEIKRINDSRVARADGIPSTRMVFVKFNNLQPPFKGNNDLRLALNYAIDKEAIKDAIWSGFGTLSNCQPLNESYFGYNPDLKPFPYDPGKAKELLAKAGYPNGLTLEFEIPVNRYLLGTDIVQAVASQLAEIGVQTKITELEYGRWIDKYQNAGGMAQMSYIGQSWPTLDADGMLGLFEPGNAYAYYDNDKFKSLIREARVTIDRDKRQALYKNATASFCENPAHLFLFNQPTTYGQSNRIEWKARSDDWYRAIDVSPKAK